MVLTRKLSLLFQFVVMTNEQMELGVQNLIWLQFVNISTDSVWTAVHAPADLQIWWWCQNPNYIWKF